MKNDAWSHIGINDESLFLSLLYDPHTNSLISHFFRKIVEHHGVKSLYIRKTEENQYRRLTEHSDTTTYEDVILASNKPLLFLNSLEARKEGDDYSGYDWGSLKIINLENNAVIAELKDGDLGGHVGNYSTWVSKVHNVSPDGEFAICSLGIPEEKEDSEFKINYYLGKVFPEKKQYELITKLYATFL